MKLNKDQRHAIVVKIKQLANEQQLKYVEQIKKSWTPSDGYLEVLKQFRKLQKETDKMIELINKYNYQDTPSPATSINYEHQSFSDQFIDRYMNRIKNLEIQRLSKDQPKFNFTYLENDIILSTINSNSIDEIIQSALKKYKV